ncbi:MAG: LamG domain-containing protein [Candidatus Paceibacterota bacterium]
MNKLKIILTKYKVLIFGVVFACLVFVHTQQAGALVTTNTAGQNLTNGLVGWWTFDGKNMTNATATDVSGNGNNGTRTNGPLVTKGKIGQGLYFDGSNDYVSVPDASSFAGSNVKTVSFWFKRNSLTTNLPRLLEESSTANQSNYWAIGIPQTGNADENSIIVTIVIGGVTSYRKIPNNSVNKLNTWYHAVVTWDGTTTLSSVYLNGVPQTMSAAAGYAGAGVVRMTIGNRGDNLRPFDGTLDDVRIYNRVLSAQEIYTLYKSQAGSLNVSPTFTLTSGLVGWWTFDGKNMTSATATDMSGSGYHGTRTNGTTAVIGKIGQALDFDGVDDYVKSNLNKTAIGSTLSISFWMNLRGAQSTKGIMQIAGSLSDTSPWILLKRTSPTQVDWFLNHSYPITENVSDNLWYHMVLTYDGTTWRAYKNSVPDGSYVGSIGTDAGTYTWIGNGYNGYINGKIDDFRIYNRALSSTEIYALYKSQAGSLNVSPTFTLTSGLVGWWTFDGKNMTSATATDVSGNGNNGTLTNGPTVAIGKIGQGLRFDGVNDYFTAGNSAALRLTGGPMTLSAWVYTSTTTYQNFMYHGLGCSTYASYYLSIGGTESAEYPNKYSFGFGTSNTTANKRISSDSNAIINKWTHVAGTYNGSTLSLYINGNLSTTTSATGVAWNSLENLSVGADPGCGIRGKMTGSLDDVRVYNRSLSASEIYSLYKLGGK